MKKFVFFIGVLLVATASPSEARSKISIRVGDTAIVSRFSWVECMNPKPLKKNYDRTLKILDRCSVESGGHVTVVAVDLNRNLDSSAPGIVLLEYREPDDGHSDLNPCPTGTLYMTSFYRFSVMRQEWEKQAPIRAAENERRERERRYVQLLLEKNTHR